MISARLSANAQISAFNIFSQNRLVHLSAGRSSSREGSSLESAETQETPETHGHKSFTEKLDETKKTEFEAEWNSNALKTSKQLAKEIDVKDITGKSLLTRMEKNYNKNLKPKLKQKNIDITFDKFWEKTLTTETSDGKGPYKKVFLEKHNDNNWYFAFRDSKGNLLELGAEQGVSINQGAPPVEIDTKIRQAQARRTETQQKIERTSAGEGVAIDVTPPAKPETSQAGARMRTIDNAAEEAEQKRLQKEKQGQKTRNKAFGQQGADGGKLLEEQRKLTVYELYPNAQPDDKITIRRSATNTSASAKYNGEKWIYTEGGKPNEAVKIYAKDDIRFTPAPESRKGPQPPEEMTDKRPMGYFRVKENVSWKDIARTVMCTGSIPRGTEFTVKTSKESNPEENSPQAILEKKGYDPSNPEDVKTLAELLKSTNGSDKLNVWITMPRGKNPRIKKANIEQQKRTSRVEARRRRTAEMIKRSDEDYNTYLRLYKTMIDNKSIHVRDKISDIVSDTELWKYYWNGKFEGKERIMKGLNLFNIPIHKARQIIENTIDQGDNDLINFEDLLDAFDNYDIVIYKSHDGTNNDYDDFREEWIYQQIAYKVSKNIDAGRAPNTNLTQEQYEWFEDNKEDFEPGMEDHMRGSKKAEMKNIMEGCALILDGIMRLDSSLNVETAENTMEREEETKERKAEAREEAAEQGRLFERPATRPSAEEIYLQKIFHPQESQALEDVAGTSYEKASGVYGWVYDEDERTYFRKEMSDATAYRMIKYNASVEGHLDRNLMVNELNSYTRRALINFNSLPYPEGENNEHIRTHKEDLAKRYGLDPKYCNPQPEFMDATLAYYSITPDLPPLGSPHDEHVRALVSDGYLATRQMAEGRVERAETPTEWVNLNEILSGARHPATREAIQGVLATNPNPKPTEEEIKTAVEQLDQQFEQPNNLFDINAGVDTNTGKVMLGLSKSVVKIGGFNLKVGFAIDLQTGEPLIGVMASQEIPLTEQWAAEIQGGIGATVPGFKFAAGIRGGFRWTSKGAPNSNYQEYVRFGTGVGSSMAFNLTDIYLGPHIYVEGGQKQNSENRYQLMMEKQLAETGYASVEAAPNEAEKAREIRSLPAGVGEYMIEVQFNMHWTDRELVNFYEQNLKNSLETVTQRYVVDDSSVISEWGIGGSVDPIKLTIMAAAAAAGTPALVAVTVAMYGRIGFVVGNKIEIKRELRHRISDRQMQQEQEMIRYIESRYPGIDIEVSAETMDASDQLISREFSGDQLQRMIGREQPARMQMDVFNPPSQIEFSNLQKEFAKHHLNLTIDPETKMYAIEPTEVENFRVLIDSKMENNSAILKRNKILISTTAGLTQLHIKRFDAFYPGTIDGAVQHTAIAITDNPNRKVGELSDYNKNYFESRYNRERDLNNSVRFRGPRNNKQQSNIMTFDQYMALPPEQRTTFATSETPPPEILALSQERAVLQASITQSDRALDLPIMLGEEIDINNLLVNPDKFITNHPWEYRQLTTNPNQQSIERLDNLIKNENPTITVDQLILFKEKLFQKSMSEEQIRDRKTTIKKRIDWAEKAVFTPFFKRQIENLKLRHEDIPPHITAEVLARQFSSDLKQTVSNKPQEMMGGQSLFTAVGTYNIDGIRTVPALSGQNNELNQFAPGFNYGQFLSTNGSTLTETQHWIGKMLLEQHSEIPTGNKEFLQSRLAKKLFYMGKKGEVPNPLIDIIGTEYFEKLIGAYNALEKGQKVDFNNGDLDAAINQFRKIAEKIRTAQLKGITVMIDNRSAKAVQIGNYYFVIETLLMSGVYEYCKNPSTLYNEGIHIFREQKIKDAISTGSVSSAAADVTTVATRTHGAFSLGLTGVGTQTFETSPSDHPPGGGGGGEPKPEAGPGAETGGESGSTTPEPTIPPDNRMTSPGEGGKTGGAGQAT